MRHKMKYICRDWPSFEANPFISSYSWDVSSWVFLRDLKLNIPQTEPIPFPQASVPSSSFHIPRESWLEPAGHRILPLFLSLFLYPVGGPALQRRDSWNKVSRPPAATPSGNKLEITMLGGDLQTFSPILMPFNISGNSCGSLCRCVALPEMWRSSIVLRLLCDLESSRKFPVIGSRPPPQTVSS